MSTYLADHGHEVLVTREPGGSRLGDHIRQLLLHHEKGLVINAKAELFLFLAARAQHVEEIIRPALLEDKVVLCDRYTDSSIAYQGFARKLGVEMVKKFSEYATDGMDPHLTFYLDIDPKTGLQRVEKAQKIPATFDRMELQKMEFHLLVRQAFMTIAHENPHRVKVLDATQTPDKVFQDALSYLPK
jgi:dTMP kinase